MATARWFTYDGEFTGAGADLPYDEPDPLLLDLITSNTAYQAYSMRKLSLDYVGAAVKVRRSSDSTTLDIGFDSSGLLDTAALLAFVGAGDGFVDTWYDQSGNARNMVQATTSKQPKLVSTGSLITLGDAPGVQFTATDAHLKHSQPGLRSLITASGATAAEVHTDNTNAFVVVSYGESDQNTSGGRLIPFYWNGSNPPALNPYATNDSGTNQSASRPAFTVAAQGEVHSDVLTKPTGAGAVMWRDGVIKAGSGGSWNPTLPTSATSATLGGWAASTPGDVLSDYLNGKIGEHILFGGIVSDSDIGVLSASHIAYFGI